MKDIQTPEDIKLMVDRFYEKVNQDELLSNIFNDFARIDWDAHLPRMYNFWNTVLLSKGDYKGSPFQKHVPLPINSEHFERWLSLFHSNIDEHFKGLVAEDAKKVASTIGATFQAKLKHMR